MSRTSLGIIVIMIATAACSGADEPAATSPTPTPGPTTTDTVDSSDTPVDAGGTSVAPTSQTPDVAETARSTTPTEVAAPNELLRRALEGVGDSYTFVTTIEVDDEVVSRAEGRTVAGNTEVSLEQQGTTLTYRTIGTDRWVQTSTDGPWDRLASPPDAGDPLEPLAAPVRVELGTTDGDTTELLASYAAAALGIDSNDELTVVLAVTGDVLTALRYDGALGGRPLVLETTFASDPSLPVISAPS